MTKAEKFIQDYTMGCSNELEGGVYHEWLTPEQARRAVEIAREEALQKEPASEEIGNYDHDKVTEALLHLQEEPVSKGFAFKAIPRLLEMIEPTDRAKAYIAKLADTLEVEGYSTDAKIVRESLKRMNGDKVPMATMDEEPASEDLEEVADVYSKLFSDIAPPYIRKDAFIAGANWKEEQFEKNRLKHCDSITNEQAELEQGFIDQHLNKYQRMPTFLDAIEYGMKLQEEKDNICYEEIIEEGAQYEYDKIIKALSSEVLPCFIHGGEADEVIAKLDEVLNRKYD